MKPIDPSESKAIGWHLIARGGDMTARVHPAMQLGVLPSGDLSFEAPDAVVKLDLSGEALTLAVVAEDYELELEAGDRTNTVRVGAQTHICLDFLGHTLDIDNDFAVASAPGNALAVYVVRKGEPRQTADQSAATPMGPLSAPAHDAEIVVPERQDVVPLKAVPVDYLQREHAASAADKRPAAAQRSNVGKVFAALAGSVLVVAALIGTALYVANRGVEGALFPGDADASGELAGSVLTPDADQPPSSAEGMGATAQVPVDAGPGSPAVSQDVLVRLSALLEAEPLPDKATIDFAVESLRSLMAAYPDDQRIPAALASLNERLVEEARLSYDQGDPFRAGRLIEQATGLGLADASVAATLEYFASQPPGAAVQVSAGAAASTREPESDQVGVDAEPVLSEAEAEAMLIEALAQEESAAETVDATPSVAPPGGDDLAGRDPAGAEATDEAGLDSLVESATGIALGALAVEVIVEDVEPGQTDAATDPVLLALGPAVPLATDADGVDSRMQLALDTYLDDAITAGGSEAAISANELPDGFPMEAPAADPGGSNAEPGGDVARSRNSEPGPRFQPYSELEAVRQPPFEYPDRALEGSGGSIDVEFTVTETGRVIDVKVSGEASAVFLREAARTVRNWRFRPVQQDGEAVPVRTALRVTYRG